jgi:tripartite-type tricarboxylate transporter receptor subunit TctC
MNAVMAGQVPMLFINMVAGLPQVKAGRLRALAVSQNKRSPAAPEIPTMDESGVPGFDEGGHHGILAPAATPHAIIARLNREIVKVLHEPDVESRLAAEGAEVVGDTPEEFNAIIRADVDKFGKVIRHLGLRVN